MAQLKSVLTFRPTPGAERPTPSLAGRYRACRRQTEALAASLSAEDQMVQSCADASPTKWHLAHTGWFFETFILTPHMAGYSPLDRKFRDLFNSYYNAIGQQPDKALRNTFSRPALEEVQKYRHYVDEQMEKLLQSSGASETVVRLAELGINHEQQHQELLITDIKHAFWSNPLQPAYCPAHPAPRAGAVPEQKAQAHEEGLREIGADGGSFHFDNEGPRHKVFAPAFRFASRPATCGEYLAFMNDRGYQRPELWLSDGWKAVQSHRWIAPLYWEKDGVDWFQFTCSGRRKLQESEPVCHVSYYEADAFARWAGARLPTEFEWEIASALLPVEGNLMESGAFHPVAAAAAKGDEATQALPLQIFGDVWEWTASAYLPYPGFKPVAGALGEYNGKFMSGQMVLRGGSCATPVSHIRASYRNFFPPETRWQFSGIRLADDGV
jgi:ergothioneine biosynthesis protein EgtB